MASAETLVAVFEAITQNLERDRDDLNQLDRDDGDSGDNMVANFRLVTESLRKNAPAQSDVGSLLGQAAQVLRDDGRGATAPIYAQGLEEAAGKLKGKDGFSIDDLLPLLEGLLGGAQQAGGAREGEGSLLDVLGPGILTYMQGKREGMSEAEAILSALLGVRRGAMGTSRSPTGHGRARGRDTTGEVDPGAAGAASLLEGLFGALLQSALRGQAAPAQPEPQRQPGSADMLIDLIGGLFRRG